MTRHVVHLCEWLILSQVSSGGNNGKDKTRKKINKRKEKEMRKVKNKGRRPFLGRQKKGQRGSARREREREKKFASL